MKHPTVDIDTAVGRATDRLHDEMFEGEPAEKGRKVVTFDDFADAPYLFICPDASDGKEHDAQLCNLYDALKLVLDHQETTAMCGGTLGPERAIGFNFRLARLGAAVLRVAEDRGLRHDIDTIVQEFEE